MSICFESCFRVIFEQMKLWNILLTFVNEKFCEQNYQIKCVVRLEIAVMPKKKRYFHLIDK